MTTKDKHGGKCDGKRNGDAVRMAEGLMELKPLRVTTQKVGGVEVQFLSQKGGIIQSQVTRVIGRRMASNLPKSDMSLYLFLLILASTFFRPVKTQEKHLKSKSFAM